MRLFVAVALSDRARRDLAADVEDTRAARAAIGDDAGALRWVDPERWHLSLAFLGEVAAETVPELRARLARAASRSRPFRLRVVGAGRFADRVLWAGIGGGGNRADRPDPDLRTLHGLAGSVAAAARRCDIAVEERRYRPHLTLARAARGADLTPWAAALATHAGPAFRVEELRLVESVLGPTPAYIDVGVWRLGEPSSEPVPPRRPNGTAAGDGTRASARGRGEARSPVAGPPPAHAPTHGPVPSPAGAGEATEPPETVSDAAPPTASSGDAHEAGATQPPLAADAGPADAVHDHTVVHDAAPGETAPGDAAPDHAAGEADPADHAVVHDAAPDEVGGDVAPDEAAGDEVPDEGGGDLAPDEAAGDVAPDEVGGDVAPDEAVPDDITAEGVAARVPAAGDVDAAREPAPPSGWN